MSDPVDRIVSCFESLTPEGLDGLYGIYAPHCRFVDPFNDVSGADAVVDIFRHMFVVLDEPRFRITDRFEGGSALCLTWQFSFRFRHYRRETFQQVPGASVLRLDGDGHISEHRDYWDVASGIYEQLPAVGILMRWLKKQGRPKTP